MEIPTLNSDPRCHLSAAETWKLAGGISQRIFIECCQDDVWETVAVT